MLLHQASEVWHSPRLVGDDAQSLQWITRIIDHCRIPCEFIAHLFVDLRLDKFWDLPARHIRAPPRFADVLGIQKFGSVYIETVSPNLRSATRGMVFSRANLPNLVGLVRAATLRTPSLQ